MEPPDGSVSKQGYEQQLGVNVLAPFLFTLCLRDIMIATAKTAPPGSVRVCWVSSIGATYAPKPAIDFDNMDYVLKNEGAMTKYNRSKAGTCLHSYEFQRRYGSHGIVSVVCRSTLPFPFSGGDSLVIDGFADQNGETIEHRAWSA